MKTVLIIEDDNILSDMYRDKFAFEGFNVVTADDGKKGLELVSLKNPDIVLLDLALPKISGLDILEKLRTTGWSKTIPIIIMTNLNVDGKVLEAITKYNPAYCLLKSSTTPEDVVSKAKEILKHE